MSQKSFASLSFFLFLLSVAAGCKAQTPAATPPARSNAGANSGSLSAEIVHRIENEIRSRYSVPPEVEISVSDPQTSDVPGYDKLIVTFTHDSKNNTFDFLISKDRKTLARLEKIDISQDLMSKINVKGRPVRGNKDAKVTIVNFDDFQCPFCARMHATLFPGMLKEYGSKVKIIYKDYPLLEIHPWALHAAIDANCLADQNSDAYWDFADYVHGNARAVGGTGPAEAYVNLDKQTLEEGEKYHLDAQKLKACVDKSDETSVRASIAEADQLGVDSTPTLFINGARISGAVPEDKMRSIISRALADAGEKAPATAAKN